MTARTLLPQPPSLMTLLPKSPQTEHKFSCDRPSFSPFGAPVWPLFTLLGRFSSIMGALPPPPPHRPTVEHELRSTQWRLPLDPPPSPPLLRRSHPCFTRGSYRRANQSRRFFFVILSSRGAGSLLPPCPLKKVYNLHLMLVTLFNVQYVENCKSISSEIFITHPWMQKYFK